MSSIDCSRELDILRLARTPSGLGASDRAHLQACESCRLAILAEAALAPLARSAPPAHLPPAGVVLLRAKLAARREAAERALAPLGFWRGVIAVVATAGTAGLFLGGGLMFANPLRAGTSPNASELAAAFGMLVLAAVPFLSRLRLSRSDL